ncbi:MAG: DUF4406 domain-containing protein [Alphaproteobacteria bacterium]|nr:DUF4406 domain-containing protein [Alphaproteobacteria bacterium]
MWIMVAGPYTSGANSDETRQENLTAMNVAAAALWRKGHTPIIGVNLALPVIDAAGHENFDDMMMPISLAAAERCDACLRIGGPSEGADEEADVFKEKGLPIYSSVDDVPDA